MKLTKCQKGHFYDGDVYSVCPHCAGDVSAQPASFTPSGEKRSGSVSAQSGGTSQSPPPRAVTNESNVTQVVTEVLSPAPYAAEASRSFEVPRPPQFYEAPQAPVQTPQATVSPLAAAVAQSVPYNVPGAEQKTVAFYDFGDTEPTVGWLVSVSGEHRGQSFQLKTGQNLIGRDLKMDVALTKDGGVSRNKHSVIIFDPKSAKFYIQPGESGLVYVNGDLVLVPAKLNARDKIELGGTALLLVPLCGDGFSWDDYQ
ncbi:MAG: FHA domain-containing protein [Oscillospiraceae bacterium]|jgi:hypothetical protein|nr:FHA domain-containing protein [Oscillospiraceae bacterium]